MGKAWEYYCWGCKQLRLYISRKGEKPTQCARCKHQHVEVGEVGDPELTKLRYGNNGEPPTDISVEIY